MAIIGATVVGGIVESIASTAQPASALGGQNYGDKEKWEKPYLWG